MNLWHDIDAGTADEIVTIIEIPKGSHNKYEIDKVTGLMALDRANYSAAPYPCEYGFIPQTLGEDEDAADVLLLATYPIQTGIMVRVRPVALMEMVDTGEPDHKIVAVPLNDKRWDQVKDLSDINPHTLKELQHFFETYKEIKGVSVEVPGFKDAAAARAEFERSKKLYAEKFRK